MGAAVARACRSGSVVVATAKGDPAGSAANGRRALKPNKTWTAVEPIAGGVDDARNRSVLSEPMIRLLAW
jgi:hypothetical protein